MVNNDPLRRLPYKLPPNPIPADRRSLKLPGPRYQLDLVKTKATPDNIRLLTSKCDYDVRHELKWTVADAAELILALEDTDYHDSEWCESGARMLVDCDSYSLRFDIIQLVRSSNGVDIYVKFGFRPTHPLLLLLSCHKSLT